MGLHVYIKVWAYKKGVKQYSITTNGGTFNVKDYDSIKVELVGDDEVNTDDCTSSSEDDKPKRKKK
jgi:hypothetical protein